MILPRNSPDAKRVYIFFNDQDPKDFATRKLALLTAHSWRAQGWAPVFYNTLHTEGFAPFKRLVEKSPNSLGSQLTYCNAWFERLKRAPGWFSSIDILNGYFSPALANICELESVDTGCCNVTESCFSAECLWVTPEFCRKAIDLILAYDDGKFPDLHTEFVADEVILRNYAKYNSLPYLSFPYAQAQWETYPLVHAMQPVLQWFNPNHPANPQ